MPRFTILNAPSVLGLRPTGVERLPQALEAAGIRSRLGAEYAGVVEPPPYDARRDPVSGVLAIVSGHGPAVRTDIGLWPLVREEDIVAFGYRDAEQQREYGSQDIRATAIRVCPLEDVRRTSITEAAEMAAGRLRD